MVTIRKKTIKNVFFVFLLAVIIYLFYVWFAGPSYPDINTPKPVFGNPNSGVSIIEFSDVQCPACKAASSVVEQIRDDYKDKIGLTYYHFPLRSIHPYAQKAAEAVECANDQGKFWEYLDAAFVKSPNLKKSELKAVAVQVGLNATSFNACLDSGAKAGVVEGDLRQGLAKGVTATPTFFVNGVKLNGWSYETFADAIESAGG